MKKKTHMEKLIAHFKRKRQSQHTKPLHDMAIQGYRHTFTRSYTSADTSFKQNVSVKKMVQSFILTLT
jgi:hypothetical protein